jgi:hypothetical protein
VALRTFDDLLHFASTPRSRSTVTLAAISFAVCHVLVVVSSSAGTAFQDEIAREIVHFAAELGRFALPLGVMAVGMIRQLKK